MLLIMNSYTNIHTLQTSFFLVQTMHYLLELLRIFNTHKLQLDYFSFRSQAVLPSLGSHHPEHPVFISVHEMFHLCFFEKQCLVNSDFGTLGSQDEVGCARKFLIFLEANKDSLFGAGLESIFESS